MNGNSKRKYPNKISNFVFYISNFTEGFYVILRSDQPLIQRRFILRHQFVQGGYRFLSKSRLAVFTNYPSVTKDQVLIRRNSSHLMLPCNSPLLQVQLVHVYYSVLRIATITQHNVIKGSLSKVGLEGLVHPK